MCMPYSGWCLGSVVMLWEMLSLAKFEAFLTIMVSEAHRH